MEAGGVEDTYAEEPRLTGFVRSFFLGAGNFDLQKEIIKQKEDLKTLKNVRSVHGALESDKQLSWSYFSSSQAVHDVSDFWSDSARVPMHPQWLTEQCTAFSHMTGSELEPYELSASILRIMRSAKSDVELQSSLFEILGETAFEFIQLLLNRRVEILTVLTNKDVSQAQRRQEQTLRPSPQITIISEQDKLLEKMRRKEQKKQRGQTERETVNEGDLLDAKAMREQREAELAAENEPSILAAAGSKVWKAVGFGQKVSLPEGTQRHTTPSYHEVYVPYNKPAPMQAGEKLIPISEFSEFSQQAFKGMKSLNRIQSRVFETAYRTNENLLICAPTGAGKTNVALTTMVREIEQHLVAGKLQKDFKIVYVAPMKALAAEMTDNFSKRLHSMGIICRELTGDMQLTRKELEETQVIVTTPEKWDVITRKSGDVALTAMVRLLIIDEVHLLHEERGAVLEVLIARTQRQVESTQSMIRIVGLSATLPNYQDVAHFLRVSDSGLFFFDAAYRPVPLDQRFIGVKETNPSKSKAAMNDVAYEKVVASLRDGNQVMVFVHSRKDTVKTAQALIDMARDKSKLELFASDSDSLTSSKKDVMKSRNKELRDLFEYGLGIHHAGMLRADRSLTERMFSNGSIKVLCCTATLAWGVNLPAHTVVIKGTQIYDAKAGTFVDLGMLDVMQIFGRAGRPQFDTSGEGIIITTQDKLQFYLSLLTHQMPIESQFVPSLADHLNAEIVLGTVANLREAVTWLSYTYLYIRMLKNPMVYGITYEQKHLDPHLVRHREALITIAAQTLDKCRMIRFDETSGNFYPTDLGRVASHYYIKHDTISLFNEHLIPALAQPEAFDLIAQSTEFSNIMLREEEMSELDQLSQEACLLPVKGGSENPHGKVNILLQSYLSNASLDGFTLVSDTAYIAQNAARISRGLFEIVLKKGWVSAAENMLTLSKMVDRRMWHSQHPLRQVPGVPLPTMLKLEQKKATMDKLIDMSASELGHLIDHPSQGLVLHRLVRQFPNLELSATVQPITRTVLRVHVTITADFEWNDRLHGSVEPWWIWVEDAENEHIYHYEPFLLHKKNRSEPQTLVFTIPVFEPLPPQYFLRAVSDRWLGAESTIELSFRHLILPHQHPPHTELLDLQPLPVSALHNSAFEALYRFGHFNPIQTQLFHTLYHTDNNILLGAPTGSGKTIAAELAMLKLFRDAPHMKVVYIGPLKALVRERIKDWQVKFGEKLKKRVVELTGDYTPNVRALQESDIVCTTPEKWDGISRNWQQRNYVRAVGLVVIDEIHLLGEERGPILEVIVSRMRFISSHTDAPVRIIGLSTAIANARDLGDWLGIGNVGLFNFRPSVRPVPLEAHIQGYPGKHYCPRMATMNKPTYAAIQTYSREKPVLVFVSSRRQTRLTAQDLISYCMQDDKPHQFLHMSDQELENVLSRIDDKHLQDTLRFGIAMHHAGLKEDTKSLVEDLFERNKIQVLVSTSTLAWGVNLPAHLVVIKGTEYYDAPTKRYVDFPITDVLQMMGRAGRPQYDTQGVAVIMVHEPKKNFYKKFLYEPFPVESSLLKVLPDHINAEIVSGTIASKQDAIEYLTWTYFFRRLLMNPSYYLLEDTSLPRINEYLSMKVDECVMQLESARCLSVEDDMKLIPQTLGRIASYYYLHYKTVKLFAESIGPDNDLPSLLHILSSTPEYSELPVRHNEELLNADLSKLLPIPVDSRTFESPHTKAHLLLQAHFSHVPLPIPDYITDTKSVLDQAIRILQAMVDVAADGGFLFTALNCMQLVQMITQAQWYDDSPLSWLPGMNKTLINALSKKEIEIPPQLLALSLTEQSVLLKDHLSSSQLKSLLSVFSYLPVIDVTANIQAGSTSLPLPLLSVLSSTDTPTLLSPGSDAQISVQLQRRSRLPPSSGVYAPRFPKSRDESWWIVLGHAAQRELLALRRLSSAAMKTSTTLSFQLPDRPGDYIYSLYVMSDTYLGFDQQYDIRLQIK